MGAGGSEGAEVDVDDDAVSSFLVDFLDDDVAAAVTSSCLALSERVDPGRKEKNSFVHPQRQDAEEAEEEGGGGGRGGCLLLFSSLRSLAASSLRSLDQRSFFFLPGADADGAGADAAGGARRSSADASAACIF